MSTVTDRVTAYFLNRLRRDAVHRMYVKALEAGLLERLEHPNPSGTITRWALAPTAMSHFSGNGEQEPAEIARLLSSHAGKQRHYDAAGLEPDEHSTVRSMAKDAVDRQRDLADDTAHPQPRRGATGIRSSSIKRHTKHAIARTTETMLRMLRDQVGRPRVIDVATLLLVARAIGETVSNLSSLLDIVGQPNPLMMLKVPARGFERRFGEMLEAGLIVPFGTFQVDGAGQGSLSGNFRDKQDRLDRRRRIVTFSGSALKECDEARIRRLLGKAILEPSVPIVVADETHGAPAARLAASVDILLTCDGIDAAIIVELLQICSDIAPKQTLKVLAKRQYVPRNLGIDDLAVAVRPGRSLNQIIATLEALDLHNQSIDDEEGQAKEKTAAKGKSSLDRRGKPLAPVEVIQPTAPSPDNADDSKTRRHNFNLENLAGYGEARTWALELRQDLDVWRNGNIGWSDMNTKLLLSGPPGTGKTTFARALSNSLQIPMIAVSVGQWLEPGYLGDVLQNMSAAFEVAREHSPVILLIDEIDNIGKRGGGPRDFTDYWNSIVNRMLELLDGTNLTEGVIVIGATNRPEAIDEALLRSGRLERHVVIPEPDIEALAGILASHLGADLAQVISTAPKATGDAEPSLTRRPVAAQAAFVSSKPISEQRAGALNNDR